MRPGRPSGAYRLSPLPAPTIRPRLSNAAVLADPLFSSVAEEGYVACLVPRKAGTFGKPVVRIIAL